MFHFFFQIFQKKSFYIFQSTAARNFSNMLKSRSLITSHFKSVKNDLEESKKCVLTLENKKKISWSRIKMMKNNFEIIISRLKWNFNDYEEDCKIILYHFLFFFESVTK